MNAEGQAADAKQRLRVAQEQIAEFAHERESDAAQLAQECAEVLKALPPDTRTEVLSLFQARGLFMSRMKHRST